MLGHNICEVAQNFNILECKKKQVKNSAPHQGRRLKRSDDRLRKIS